MCLMAMNFTLKMVMIVRKMLCIFTTEREKEGGGGNRRGGPCDGEGERD